MTPPTGSSAVTNMQKWQSTCGTGVAGGCSGVTPSSQPFCAVELMVAGVYPNSRYFSLAGYDEHYTTAQHIADFVVDPAAQGAVNPFSGGTNNWQATNYLTPIKLGALPPTFNQQGSSGRLAGCEVLPSEEDNILDGTQRHPDGDWNTNVFGSPGIAYPQPSHVSDDPAHGNPNPAGGVHVRAYLSPPYTCPSGSLGHDLDCSLPSGSYFPDNGTTGNTFFLVRDSYTGCAYTSAAVTSLNMLATGTNTPAATQFLAESSQWQDQNQLTLHTNASQWTPQLCYSDGDPGPISSPTNAPFGNRVAWTRTPAHVAGDAPDDAYVAAAISAADLVKIINNDSSICHQAQSGGSSPGCVIRMRLRLPQTPTNAPCQPIGTSSNCPLPGSPDQLRYTSLTFGYLPAGINSSIPMIADMDGQNSALGPNSYSIASLADTVFAAAANAGGYVTLIVNVNPNLIGYNINKMPVSPVGIAFDSASSGGYSVASAPALQGSGPVQPLSNHLDGLVGNPAHQTTAPYYTAWMNTVHQGSATGPVVGDPYVVLDLTQFGDFWDTNHNNDLNSVCTLNNGSVQCNSPLILTLRSTMPTSSFTCSAFNVPYSTAEYTNYNSQGGGFMGPYVPLVDYVAVGSLTNATQANCGNGGLACPAQLPPPPALGSTDLPSASSCPNFPASVFPLNNGASSANQAQFPVQYWPNTNGGTTAAPNLSCPAITADTSKFQPQIDFVATQFTMQVRQLGEPANTTPFCQNQYTGAGSNTCVQIIEQATEAEVSTYQPPLSLTIVGKGFGYLSGLPWAGTNPSNVVISNDDNSHNGANPWHTTGASGQLGNCQVYITEWSDNKISLQVGLPTQVANPVQNATPYTVMNPLSFFQLISPTLKCPVSVVTGPPVQADNITVLVKNPQQTGNSTTAAGITVQATGSVTPY
jgi:hypothetical protein